MHEFDFVRPGSVDEAARLLADEDAMALAGGQTLIPALKARLAAPTRLVSLSGIPDLDFVRSGEAEVEIGAGTTHATIAREAASAFPGLADLAGRIGDPAVRSRGTIGGSLANNDPAACYPAAVLATEAVIVTQSREISASRFFDGLYTTTLEQGEIITSVRFPVPEAAHYEKFHQPASRFPMAAAFVARFGAGVRVAITGAGADGVFRWSDAEEALNADFRAASLSGLSPDPDDMIGDIHGSPEYRAHLVAVVTRRAVERLS